MEENTLSKIVTIVISTIIAVTVIHTANDILSNKAIKTEETIKIEKVIAPVTVYGSDYYSGGRTYIYNGTTAIPYNRSSRTTITVIHENQKYTVNDPYLYQEYHNRIGDTVTATFVKRNSVLIGEYLELIDLKD